MNCPILLLYTIPYSKKNFKAVRDICIDYTKVFLELAHDPKLDAAKSTQTEADLLQHDVRLRQFCGRDPDTKNVANIFGLDTTDKLVRTLWGSPDDPIWSSR